MYCYLNMSILEKKYEKTYDNDITENKEQSGVLELSNIRPSTKLYV